MFIFSNVDVSISAEDVRKLKNRVATLEAESSVTAARTGRLSGSSNDLNFYGATGAGAGGVAGGVAGAGAVAGGVAGAGAGAGGVAGAGGGGTAHTDNTLHLDAGGGGGSSGSKTRIVIAGAGGGAGAGHGVDVIFGGGSAGANGAVATGANAGGGAGTSGSASRSVSTGTSFSGSAGGTGLGTGVSGGHIDATSLQMTIRQMLRTEMQSQSYRGTAHIYIYTYI